jgi:hypothetical protein
VNLIPSFLPRRPLGVVVLVGCGLVFTGCLGYAPEGGVATPPPPSSDGSTSRLPALLSQLQGGGAAVEVFDGSQNEVLAAQDEQGKAGDDPTATDPPATETVAGAATPGAQATATPAPGSIGFAQPTATTTPAPSTTASPSATPTPTPTSTPTAGPTATPTATPVPTIPSEGDPPSEGGLPPTEE